MKESTTDLNVNGQYKKEIFVDACELMTQSMSRSRGGRMDIDPGTAYPNDQKLSEQGNY